jgi:tryptophanyl-tRNA synthetase
VYCVLSLVQITLAHNAEELARATRTSAAIYIACGIDPSKASIFVQSHVQAHSELTWLLSCVTPISWLNKMIQFKEKSRKSGEDVGVGLLTYPLLMASDILLYQSDLVPVGEDQRQHLELTRDVADRVNHLYGGRKWKKLGGRGGRVFKVPEALIPPTGARVMSLTDGMAKMSKSATSDLSRINLLDTPDEIANKIKRCKTDSVVGMEFGNEERPECNNLLAIYQLVSGKTQQEVVEECAEMSWGQFKPVLTEALVMHLQPIQVTLHRIVTFVILYSRKNLSFSLLLGLTCSLALQEKYAEVVADPVYLDSILAEGAAKANLIADSTLQNVYNAMGFLPKKKPIAI